MVNNVNRNKPDISAPNGVNTTVYMGGQNIDGDAFPNFFGTSAAAPHVAGAAALLIEAKQKFTNQAITPAQIKSLMQSTAVEMYNGTNKEASGAGLLQADAMLKTFAKPNPKLTALESVGNANYVPGSTLKAIGENCKVLFSLKILFNRYF